VPIVSFLRASKSGVNEYSNEPRCDLLWNGCGFRAFGLSQLVTRDKVNFLLSPFASNFALDHSSVAEKYQIPNGPGRRRIDPDPR
jgi:hypothetical protein